MGVALLFLGFIQEAHPGSAGNNDEKRRKVDISLAVGRQTDEVLESLPDEDKWPPLCKPMFGWPPSGAPLITYERRLVHFAASVKNVDFALRDWLDKFESLLRRLYWQEAYLRVEQGYIGPHEFRWRPKKNWIDALYGGHITPITEWDFTTTLDNQESLRERHQTAR
jgi:hypothetical protein